MAQYLIEFQKLNVHFGSFHALKEIQLEIKPQSTCVLVGTSGSGKTSLLKCINGLNATSGGKLLIEGKRIPEGDLSIWRRKFGYVIQAAGLFPHKNVFENISILGHVSAWNQETMTERSRELLQLLHLDPDVVFKKFPHELSGGEKQRVGLARALFLDPPYLLMDEPFGALDPVIRRDLQAEFKTLNNRLKKTVVMVTHDMEEAFHFGHQIVVMNAGEVIQVGTSEEIKNNPASNFVKEFFKQVESK